MTRMFIFISLVFLFGSRFYANASSANAAATIDQFSGKPCYKCHQSKLTAPYVHSALTDRKCTPCHKTTNGNHQNNHSFSEVKERSSALCYECHDNRSRQKSVHPPIIANDCLCCHAPHASTYQHLLRFELKGLCFECHAHILVTGKETSDATGFRNKEQNLHYLHAGKIEIPCLTCHDVHDSNQLHLIRPKGFSGRETVTISYIANATGGNCTTSCHEAMAYSRQ